MFLSDENAGRSLVRLSDLPNRAAGRVHELKGEAKTCQRLREMGFCETAVVEKLSGVHTLLCQVCGTRIALSGRIAQHILVEQIRQTA